MVDDVMDGNETRADNDEDNNNNMGGGYLMSTAAHVYSFVGDVDAEITTCTTNITAVETEGMCDHLVTSYYDGVFYAYYYGLLGVLTLINVVGNAFVISSVLRHRSLRVPANYFLFSIACSDLTLGIIYPIYNVSHIDLPGIKHVLGDWMLCTTTLTVYLGLQSISAYSLVGVAVARFVSIRDPLKFPSIVTRSRVINVLIAIWIVLFLLSGALYFRTASDQKYSRVCRYEYVQSNTDLLATCLLSVFLPLLIMTTLYCFVVVKARQHVIAMADSRCSFVGRFGSRRYIIRKELRMVAMTGLLLGYFAFAWIPFVIYEFYTINRCTQHIDRESCEPNRYVRATVRLVLHSNSAINFFIYAARLRDFQAVFWQDIRRLMSAMCCSRRCRRLNDVVAVRRRRPPAECVRTAVHDVLEDHMQASFCCDTSPRDHVSRLTMACSGQPASWPNIRTSSLVELDENETRVVQVNMQHISDSGEPEG